MKEAKTMIQLHLPSGCSPSQKAVDPDVDVDVDEQSESRGLTPTPTPVPTQPTVVAASTQPRVAAP